jgi:hypothetical protein
MVIKMGTLPAKNVSEPTVAMMARDAAPRVPPLMWDEECTSTEVVGWESLTIPLGTIRALHVKSKNGDAWIARDVPFALVRMSTRDGAEIVLTGYGVDAKSSLVEDLREGRR